MMGSPTVKIGVKRCAPPVLILGMLVVLAGCESLSSLTDSLPDQRLVYKRQREAVENLEIPPDLTAGSFDDALDIPGGVERPTTFSEYAGGRAQRQQVAAQGGEVLPSFQNIELKRRGDERWLEVQAKPQAVWPRVVAFWREQGILLVEQNPALGLMRTDWLDNRAEIRKDFITRMVSKVAEGLYSTSTRDQYTLRIEEGLKPGTTDIRLTHRGMAERLVDAGIAGSTERTIWEPSGSDREKEAEMLRRLMVYLGAAPSRTAGTGGGEMTAGQLIGASSRLANENGAPVILVPQELRSAWRLVGSALDRAGFAVEDRDQGQGMYYVRYAGQDAPPERPGLMSRLAFWRKPKFDPVKQYQIKVSGNDKESRVMVLAADGRPDTSADGQRILALIQEQLR